MKNLAATGYDPALVSAALESSGRTLTFGYEWLDGRNAHLGTLPNVVPGGSVSNSALASVKRTLAVTVLGALDPGFDYTSHRIRPWVGLLMPDGGYARFTQGVFLIDAPTTKYNAGVVTLDCVGHDQGQVLTDDTVTARYLITAGTPYTDAIAALMTALPAVSITPSDLVLPVDRLWDAGTTKLAVVNDLCDALNYGSLWFDGDGVGQVQPYTSPDSAPAGYAYTDVGDRSLFVPDVSSTVDMSGVPNYIVFTVSQPGRPVLTSVYSNTDVNSPVSIPNRGRRIVRSDATIDVATKVELDALVRRAAVNAANVYRSVTWSSPVMPIHENRDVLEITHQGLGLAGRFTETDWKLDLKAGGLMTHTVRQVVNLDGALIGTPDATQ